MERSKFEGFPRFWLQPPIVLNAIRNQTVVIHTRRDSKSLPVVGVFLETIYLDLDSKYT